MAASCSSTCTSINQLQEITGCSNSQAVKLLQLAKGDVAVAVDMFFDQEGLVVIDTEPLMSSPIIKSKFKMKSRRLGSSSGQQVSCGGGSKTKFWKIRWGSRESWRRKKLNC